MSLEEILNKDIADLTKEEKDFLRKHSWQLTGGQCQEYEKILNEGKEKVRPKRKPKKTLKKV